MIGQGQLPGIYTEVNFFHGPAANPVGQEKKPQQHKQYKQADQPVVMFQ